MSLLVNKAFIEEFRKEVQLYNNVTFRIDFNHKYHENRENYQFLLEMINKIEKNVKWIEFTRIRLPYSDELNDNKLQFWERNTSFEKWKQKIMEFEQIKYNGLEDQLDFEFNYRIQDEEGNETHLYTIYNDSGNISVCYNESHRTTYISISLELRKELFDKSSYLSLPQYELEQNRIELEKSLRKFESDGYSVECGWSRKNAFDKKII